jgi:hypothetical protein
MQSRSASSPAHRRIAPCGLTALKLYTERSRSTGTLASGDRHETALVGARVAEYLSRLPIYHVSGIFAAFFMMATLMFVSLRVCQRMRFGTLANRPKVWLDSMARFGADATGRVFRQLQGTPHGLSRARCQWLETLNVNGCVRKV